MGERVRILSAQHDEMPGLIQRMSIGLSFITPHPSKAASCPTKLGEYLACGVPVICNRGIGDVEKIISASGAGALWDGEEDTESVFGQMDDWIVNRDALADNCRRCAENIFSVSVGAQRYDSLYRRIIRARAESN